MAGRPPRQKAKNYARQQLWSQCEHLKVLKYVNVSYSILVLTGIAPLTNDVMLQKIVSELSIVCDGNPLMLALVASAVVKAALDDEGLYVTDIKPWENVRDNFSAKLADVGDTYDYKGPMMAYAMSVERLDDLAASVLPTLCLFPPAKKLPLRMVLAIWEQARGIEKVTVKEDFAMAISQLKRAAIIDKTSSGETTPT